MEKVKFALDIQDDWPPVASENVWCEKVGDNYILKNSPFFISGLALNDVFSATLDPVNEHIFEFEVIQNSGHSVVWFMNNIDLNIDKLLFQLRELGCSYEGFQQFSLWSVDVPPDVDFEALEQLIDVYEGKGIDFAFPVWRANGN